MTDKFTTQEEFADFRLKQYNKLSQKFQEYLNTVPEEYREATVEDHLNNLVKHGWIKKEDIENLYYKSEYKGDK